MTSPMVIPLFAIGLISILGQVILLRELHVAFYGNELIYVFGLGLWIFWTAVGAISLTSSSKISLRKIHLSLFFLGPLILGDVAFIRGSHVIFSGTPGAELPLPQQILITVTALFPIAFVTGLLFSGTAKAYLHEQQKQQALSMAYAVESAGGLCGGILATLSLSWGIQNFQLAVCCVVLSFLIPLMPGAWSGKTPYKKRWYFAVLVLISAITAWMWPFSTIDRKMTGWNHSRIITSKDTPYGRMTLTGLSGQVSLFENNALLYESEGADAETFIHLAALQHPAPQSILLLGGGAEGLIKELLQHRPEKIDYVELNEGMLRAVTPYLPIPIQASLQDSRLHIIFNDPRSFLEKSGFYDLIIVGMPEPASGQANRFYSREFYQQCAAHLKPQGILGFRLKSAENFWTPPLTLRMGSIYRALRTVFPECVFLPGAVNVVTASFSLLPANAEIPATRWQERKISSQLINPSYLSYLYTNDRFIDLRQCLEKTTVPPNRDLNPICYQYSAMIWLAKFFPQLNAVKLINPFPSGDIKSRLLFFIVFIMTVSGFSIFRLYPQKRRLMLMAVAGFVGMVLETVLLLNYQVKCGALYQEIGVLLMSFMAGLALGAIIFNRRRPKPIWGHVMALGFFALNVLVYESIITDQFSGLIPTMVLLGLAGLFVSAFFSLISFSEMINSSALVSPLYAADLMGGCMGSLVSGLLLIPFFGLDITMALMIVITASLIILA